MCSNESLVVHVGKRAHDELTIKSIGDSTMSRNRVAKIFDLKGAFDTRSKETAEWSNERCKGSKEEDMELERLYFDALWYASPSRKLDW
jgi:hypothetical protein